MGRSIEGVIRQPGYRVRRCRWLVNKENMDARQHPGCGFGTGFFKSFNAALSRSPGACAGILYIWLCGKLGFTSLVSRAFFRFNY